ncbi:MAG TPA: hypothetical protein VFS50_05080 [Meiothermus sp.]|nr:hypothetical protein [Meiothermus sp.]
MTARWLTARDNRQARGRSRFDHHRMDGRGDGAPRYAVCDPGGLEITFPR